MRVTDVPTLVFRAETGDVTSSVAPASNYAEAYVGGSDVTDGEGYPLRSGVANDVRPGDELWGVCASGDWSYVRVLLRSA